MSDERRGPTVADDEWPWRLEGLRELGDDHWYRLTVWRPDVELNPQYADLPGDPDEPVGATVLHLRPDGTRCMGGIKFDTPRGARLSGAKWTLVSLEPLHVEPSLLCKAPVYGPDGKPVEGAACGDHGFIREGRWVRA